MDRLLFIDTETGGLNPKQHSLLSIGMAVWDSEAGIIYSKEICQKLDHYNTTPEALQLNHFDLNNYDPSDILSAKEIEQVFIQIKDTYFPKNKQIPLAGHNVQFDVAFIKEMFEKNNLNYSALFSHRLMDMYSILRFLIQLKKVPSDINNSTKAFEYFQICDIKRHTALGDSIGAAKLYSLFLSIMKE